MIISAFETMEYDGVTIANIVQNPYTYLKRISNKYEFVLYEVPYNTKAESLSYKLYNNCNLQWIFSLLNSQIRDGGFNDWLLTQDEIYEYTLNKYSGVSIPENIHHYEDENGLIWYNMNNRPENPLQWFNADDDSEEILYHGTMIPKTNLEYERQLNDDKFRNILIVKKGDINQFVTDMLTEIRKGV